MHLTFLHISQIQCKTNLPFAQTLSIFNMQDKDKVSCCHHCNVPLEPMTGKEKWEAETVSKSLPHWNELEKNGFLPWGPTTSFGLPGQFKPILICFCRDCKWGWRHKLCSGICWKQYCSTTSSFWQSLLIYNYAQRVAKTTVTKAGPTDLRLAL